MFIHSKQKQSVAYDVAPRVPIAVPTSCSHYVLPNVKMLLDMTKYSTLMMSLLGKCLLYSPANSHM